ncbi:helix-turn-helix domain-containing protein [Halovivax cerinus]|uniref:Helix-turn-helix domain-containing protein n=1 Tax=Halovivax cerinus TaxID=1487865 RepID=A0ABD5NJN4_9EURY|nr:helix-turn-helix domain-containing protein [Halovivax cerinus]
MESPDGVDAFDVLADPTRWQIVSELAKHRRDTWRPVGLGFADLRKAIGVRDAGLFNYHLSKLTDRFVHKIDDEYVLTNEGLSLVGRVLSGAYDPATVTRRESTSHVCPRCEETLVAIYEHGYVRLRCPTHDDLVGTILSKRPVRDRPIDEVVEVAGRSVRSQLHDAKAGLCPHCRGRTVSSLLDEPPSYPNRDLDDLERSEAFVGVDCTDCGFHFAWPATVYVVDHPATVAFRHELGDDQSGLPYLGTSLERVTSWRIPVSDGSLDSPSPSAAEIGPGVPAVDPPEGAGAVVELVAEDDSLRLWLRADASVLDTHLES